MKKNLLVSLFLLTSIANAHTLNLNINLTKKALNLSSDDVEFLKEVCPQKLEINENGNVAEQVIEQISQLTSLNKIEHTKYSTAGEDKSLSGHVLKRVYLSSEKLDYYPTSIMKAITVEQITNLKNQVTAVKYEIKLLNYTHSAEIAESLMCDSAIYTK